MKLNDKSLGSGARKLTAYVATLPERSPLGDAMDALLAFRHGDPKHLTQEHARLLYETLQQLKRAGSRGGPTEANPERPYCKPDQSCCDFTCGN